MATIFRQLSPQLYTIPRCHTLIKLLDPNNNFAPLAALRNLGDSKVEVDNKIEFIDIKSNEDSNHAIVNRVATDIQSSLKITLRQFDAATSALAFLAASGLTQPISASVASTTATFTGVSTGGLYQLLDIAGAPQYPVTIISVTDDTLVPVVYVESVNYLVDKLSGTIEVLSIPLTASNNVVVTYSVPAVTLSNALPIYEYLSQPQIYAGISIRTNNKLGKNRWLEFPLVMLAPTSGFKLSEDGGEPMSVDFEATVLQASWMPTNRQRGWIRDLT